ncbi:MAG: Ig-like domain-containing protein, partial [Flavobacteriales bacterium]
MRNIQTVFLALFIALLPNAISAQVSDDFSDNDFTANPAWTGETTKFEVDGNQKLHLNAPSESDTAYLSTPSQAIDDATWEFLVELDFNPSSSNVARVYLASNNENLRASLNGYYVRVGGETQDRISLYRQDGLISDQLITSADGLVSTDPVNARIRVTRTAGADWELLADTAGGTAFTSIGTVNDATYFQSLHVGVHCKYTSTRSDKFYFDDFSITGTAFVDSEAPIVTSVTVISDTEVDVLFNESIEQTTAETTANYNADGGLGNPSIASLDGGNPSLVHLTFATSFTNGTTYNLSISNVQDLAANTVVSSVEPFTYVVTNAAGFRDVVINEFMCDPTPFVGLADAEFVEVFNTSSNYIDLT